MPLKFLFCTACGRQTSITPGTVMCSIAQAVS